MADPFDKWCLIESDPLIFTDMLQKIGVNGLVFEELLSFDPLELQLYKRVYGLVFLHYKPHGSVEGGFMPTTENNSVFFTPQTADSSGATVALVNILSNVYGVDLGESLNNFLSFTKDFDPYTRGSQLSIYEPIRVAHNSCASPYEHVQENTLFTDTSGDEYHYVSYVYHSGQIWELDGLKEGPILMGRAVEEDYLLGLINAVSKRMKQINAAEGSDKIKFSLMALVDDPLLQFQKEIREDEEGNSKSGLRDALKEKVGERERNRKTTARRQHDYIPFVVELLKLLAEKEVLDTVMEEATD